MRRTEMTGNRYGWLTVLAEEGKQVEARCDCGKVKTLLRSNVLAGYSQSCGCYQKSQTSAANLRHGHRLNDREISPTYYSWRAMKARCDNPLRDHAERYIGRGITYDPRWGLFENLLEDMGERPNGTELDRRDNNLGYSKDNCRWVSHAVNCQNKG